MAPVILNGRWEQRTDLFIDSAGQEVRSAARVYLDADVAVDGYVFLGESTGTNPLTVSGARQIRDFRKTPNLKANLFERVIFL